MKDLLPFYERELAFLRNYGRAFAERYPKIAAGLLLTGESCEDPHIERMIEACALLNARVSKRLEDGYADFAESLLGILYPHYLRPFPSCSIVMFPPVPGASSASGQAQVPRGTELHSAPVSGTSCVFTTVWPVNTVPAVVSAVRLSCTPHPPAGVCLPAQTTAVLTVTLRGLDQSDAGGRLRLFIDAEPSVASVLRDALFRAVAGTFVETAAGWTMVSGEVIEPVGFSPDEALIEFPDNAHDAYRLLTEYFAFPEKFNFFDLCLSRLPALGLDEGCLTLHFALAGQAADADAVRLLSTLGADNLKTRCVPAVNLFRRLADPVKFTGTKVAYPVVVDGRRASAYEVCAIHSVCRVRQTETGESVTVLKPLFSVEHGNWGSPRNYWVSVRDALLAERSPGHETEITVVTESPDEDVAGNDVLSIELSCTNRDLPVRLAFGRAGGDLRLDGADAKAPSVRMLRRPTLPCRFSHEQEGLWRLISHLSLNQLSITGSGLEAFREMLSLYDLRRSALSSRQIDGLRRIGQRPGIAWMQGQPFPGFVRGTEVSLSVDETHFVGASLDLFVRVLEHFLGLYAQINSFVRLTVVSERTGEVLIQCKPRGGNAILA